ncbi:4'-phosphopantetheinyl transferase superfamily protein [Synechococcus sp. RSCCF101]|uniref:4'-phosphopantetheinyl transferase family protein n=1 Tax=Synechococcus sp. RSCCF101 TaxID=2511069 RepID=UPI00177D579C|nr:4'-phosphopantetheinyl transferase superfamily protein [Synechococcus sp. RSCCF101]
MRPGGKPYLPRGPRFNLSHSGGLVLLALHPCLETGVDVERARPELAWQRIAGTVLPAAVQERLAGLPVVDQRQAFLREWCRLEARLKARGWGLAGQRHLPSEPEAGIRERVWDLELPEGSTGALAVVATSQVPTMP